MDVSKFKKKGNSKEAWLDWLSDDGPSADAQAELRERFKRQANNYQPRQYASPTATQPVPPRQPGAGPLEAPARPLQAAQPQAQAAQPSAGPQKVPTASQTNGAAGVSIQINIPQLSFNRLRTWLAVVRSWALQARDWFLAHLATNKRRTIVVSSLAVLGVAGIFAPPLLHLGAKGGANLGDTNGTHGGTATAKYDKPPFTVVRPSTKPKLGTPDGVHAAYDGNKNTYSYGDSIGGNGFIVSQQPVPPQFKDGAAAVDKIGPTLNTTPGHIISTLFGDAYVSVNAKTGAQSVVATVRNLLIFIQSSHKFTDSELTDYINALQ
jgi:hypothetical protein